LVIPLKTKNRKENNMTTAELYAETLRNMSIVAEDESLMRRVAKYLRKVVAEKKADPTEMTIEVFVQRIDNARKGPSKSFANIKELDNYIRSL